MTTTQETRTSPAPALPPPRLERGTIGWVRANLLNSRFNTTLTVVVGLALIFAIWFAIQWVLSADWTVVSTVGGRFLIGNYNSDQACPGNDCFWRPQVSLMMVTFLMGMGWGVAGSKLMRNLALITVGACVVLAFLPYGFERMGMDVRVLLVANVASMAGGWALARFTRFGTVKWVVIFSVAVFILSLMVLQGASFLGIQTVDSRQWSGLQLNLILAIAGIVLSLPIGVGLALGRRSHLPVVKWLCVVFIEVFRGVPLITLLFMSQHLVPLAFPEAFPRNSLFNAGVVITMFSSAYMAENIRGGLQALHPGQAEAARALGLASWQTTVFISLPQAIRNVIPAIVGQFISLFKDTSLVYIIGMLDIVNISRKAVEGRVEFQGSAPEIFVFVAIVFWIFTYTMSYVSRRIERNLGVGQR